MSDQFMSEDQEAASGSKTTFRTSLAARGVLEGLTTGPAASFETNGEAMKMAISLALAKGHRVSPEHRLIDSGQGMSWGIASFDADGRVKSLVKHLYFDGADVSDRDVYVMAELLADWALTHIADGLKEGQTFVQIVTDTD